MNDNDTTATNEHEHEHEHGKVDGFKFTGEAKIWFSNNWESLDYIKRLVEGGGEDM